MIYIVKLLTILKEIYNIFILYIYEIKNILKNYTFMKEIILMN